MSCPGGCIGGGGQPKTRGHDVLQKRMNAVYDIDQHARLRKSHENPEVQVRGKKHMGLFSTVEYLLWSIKRQDPCCFWGVPPP